MHMWVSRGELALAFITAAEPVLRGPPGGATQHDAIQVLLPLLPRLCNPLANSEEIKRISHAC